MALESLLATLKGDVSPVADVQASNGAAPSCNGTATAAVSDVSEAPQARPADTSATAAQRQPYQREPAPLLGCTADTSATAENEQGQAAEGHEPDTPRWRWLITHAPGDVREHDFTPEATLGQARGWYPAALSIVPDDQPTMRAQQ